MPTISMFYGVLISMYFVDNKQHNLPHIHAYYQEYEAVFDIENAEMIDGNFPRNKKRLVQAWIELHKEELYANWQLAVLGRNPYSIEPLK